jgi:hypothetical protein
MDSQLSPVAILSLLFMQQIMKRKYQFLVYHNGRLHLTQISRYCLQESLVIFGQIPEDQELSQEMLNHILQCIRAVFQKLSFVIDGQLVYVDWIDVVFAGEPGRRRTLKISLPDGQIAFAKYTGNRGDLFIVDELVTKEVFEIPLANILDHTQPPSEVLQKYKDEVTAKIASQRKQKLICEEIQKRKDIATCLQFPLALPRKNTNHVLYPYLQDPDILVLFILCQKYGIQLGNNYPFNNLLIRLQACGSQQKFVHEVPRLTASEQEAFKDFERKYIDIFMGNVMVSGVQRCSKLTVQQVFLAQFQIAKALKISSQCALSLPREYFIDPEPEVILCKGDYFLVPHSSLRQL